MDSNHDEETEEEHAVRLRKISEEVKADIQAGRYKNGQVHSHIHGSYKFKGTVTGRSPVYIDWKSEALDQDPFWDIGRSYSHLMSDRHERSRRYDHIIIDECHHIDPSTYWITKYEPKPKEKDWDRKSFKSGGPTPPTDEVRAKLRAKRKAKKK